MKTYCVLFISYIHEYRCSWSSHKLSRSGNIEICNIRADVLRSLYAKRTHVRKDFNINREISNTLFQPKFVFNVNFASKPFKYFCFERESLEDWKHTFVYIRPTFRDRESQLHLESSIFRHRSCLKLWNFVLKLKMTATTFIYSLITTFRNCFVLPPLPLFETNGSFDEQSGRASKCINTRQIFAVTKLENFLVHHTDIIVPHRGVVPSEIAKRRTNKRGQGWFTFPLLNRPGLMSRSRGYGAYVSRSWRRFLENWPRKDWMIFLRSECRNGSYPSFQRRVFLRLPLSGFTVRHIYFTISLNKLKSGSSVLESKFPFEFPLQIFPSLSVSFLQACSRIVRNPGVEHFQGEDDWKSDVSSGGINNWCASTLESVFSLAIERVATLVCVAVNFHDLEKYNVEIGFKISKSRLVVS